MAAPGSNGRIVVFGSINVDLVARVDRIARPGETVLAPGYAMHFGGKGANQAVAAARVSGESPSILMAGRVGDDSFGESALDNLAREGVVVTHVKRRAAPTGCAFIAVDEAGENAITVAAGANAEVEPGDAPAIRAADFLLLQMEVPFAASLAVARAAASVGAPVFWNLAPAPAALSDTQLAALIAATRALVVNEHEALAVGRVLGLSGGPEAAAAAIARLGVVVVLTMGGAGAAAWRPDGSSCRAAAPPVEVRDTTGAGDTFVGVLAAETAAGIALEEALVTACLAGSLSCRAAGAQAGMPDRAAIAAFRGKSAGC